MAVKIQKRKHFNKVHIASQGLDFLPGGKHNSRGSCIIIRFYTTFVVIFFIVRYTIAI